MNAGLDILLVEDSEPLAANIIDFLESRGHRVDYVPDGLSGLDQALARRFDLILLDLALPRLDGLSFCRTLRERASWHVPVLMLTARDTLEDKLTGFSVGADDYLTKPFALAELEARCRALSHRHRVGTDHVLNLGPFRIDRQRLEAARDGTPLKLPPLQFRILLVLAEAHPRPVTRSDLTRAIWGEDPPDSDALRSHIHMLRQLIDKPFDTPVLETVHSVGFRLRIPS